MATTFERPAYPPGDPVSAAKGCVCPDWQNGFGAGGGGGTKWTVDSDCPLHRVENGDSNIVIVLPLVTRSLTNQRTHWAKKAKMAKAHRTAAYLATRNRASSLRGAGNVLLGVRLVRRAPRELDDDNLPPAMKSVKDGIADALAELATGCYSYGKGNDRDRRLAWEYGQERAKEYAVVATIKVKGRPTKDGEK